MRKKTFVAIIFFVLLGVLASLAACGKSKPTDAPDRPESPVSRPSSPLAAPPKSPVAAPQKPSIPGPAFALDQASLQAGGTHVKGQGPAGIPIVIVDVPLTGLELGAGFIDDQGNFDVELASPLTGGNRIGIMAGTTQPMSDAEVQAYLNELYHWRGEGARNLLHIGLLFDTAMVPE
jgi:hypothetical protein